MTEIARKRKTQAPPPGVIFEALTQPHRDPTREWLRLERGEIEPAIKVHNALRVTWSTLWPDHPSAAITFEIEPESPRPGAGSYLTWILHVGDDAAPVADEVRVLRHRLNALINRDLRNIAFDC